MQLKLRNRAADEWDRFESAIKTDTGFTEEGDFSRILKEGAYLKETGQRKERGKSILASTLL